MRWRASAAAVGVAAVLVGCAGVGDRAAAPAIEATPWAGASQVHATLAPTGEGWAHYALPGKAPVQYKYARHEGRDALAALSSASASMVRHKLRVEPADLDGLRFSWKVAQLIGEADLANRDKADSPVRVILAFEGDRSRFDRRDAMLSELARAVTGEELPYATLVYVWCNSRPAGSVIVNPRTSRIRKLVLESGGERLGRWIDYERDVRADFRRAFGEEPGALIGIALMSDTDNTRATVRAWYGPLQVVSTAARGR